MGVGVGFLLTEAFGLVRTHNLSEHLTNVWFFIYLSKNMFCDCIHMLIYVQHLKHTCMWCTCKDYSAEGCCMGRI